MFKMYRIFFVMILFLSMSPLLVEGVNWESYSENPDFRYLHETESITRPSQEIVWVWVQTNFLSEKAMDHATGFWGETVSPEIEHVKKSMELYEVDCSNRTYKTISTILYNQENSTVFSSKEELKTGSIEPYTHMELLHAAVCP